MKKITFICYILLSLLFASASQLSFAQLVEKVIYTTGFEATQGYTASTYYQNEDIVFTGPIGKQWGTYYGTPTTSTPIITHDQSMQMRWYTSTPNNKGYTFTDFDLANATKVTFKARNSSNTNPLSVIVSYSTDGGVTWVGDESIELSTTIAEKTYNISTTGQYDNVRIKFQITYSDTPTKTSHLIIDDIKVYGMVDQNATTLLTVTSPNAGDNWPRSTKRQIIWNCTNISENVKIEFTDNASNANPTWTTLAASVLATDGAWIWDIPTTQVFSDDCKIKITDVPQTISAESGIFNITNPALNVPKIFISEYIMGSSNNKAIEIYNGTGTTINLRLLVVNMYSNGSNTVSNTLYGFNGNLAAGDVYVICNNQSVEGITDYSNSSTSNPTMTYNGNDAIEVMYDGITCDIFGIIGDNPGNNKGWKIANIANATKDHTLLRKLHITQGNTINGSGGSFGTAPYEDPDDGEWVIMPKDYFGNIGAFGSALRKGKSMDLSNDSYDIPIDGVTTPFNIIIDSTTNSNVDVVSNIAYIKNVVLKKAEATTFTIQPTAGLKITGGIVDKSPTTPATAGFNLKSTSAGTGTLLHNFAASGNIERYITGDETLAARCYHGVSVPLIQGTNLVSGLFMGSYLYEFNESLNQWEGMGTPINTQLYANKGYLIYYPGYNTTYNFEGTFNHDSFEIPYQYNGTGESQGFNFVPNPYPSHIDFSQIQNLPSNLINGFWVWDNGTYRAYNAAHGGGTTESGPNISVGQAFFIKASAAGTLTLTNDCRTSGATAFYGTGNQLNALRITANGNQLQDEILFVFDNQWNLGTDEGDMLKMTGSEEAPQLSSINEENVKLTINTLPLNQLETVIPLSFMLNVSTQVQFVADISSLQSDITPYLIDKKENKTVNLRQNPVYSFNHENNGNDNRFEIKLVNATYSSVFDKIDENSIYVNSNKQIVISVPSMQNTKTLINVYDMQGKLISSRSVFLTDTFVTKAPVVPGIYMVTVSNSTQAVNKKIVITR